MTINHSDRTPADLVDWTVYATSLRTELKDLSVLDVKQNGIEGKVGFTSSSLANRIAALYPQH